jgi:hypothetical protein
MPTRDICDRQAHLQKYKESSGSPLGIGPELRSGWPMHSRVIVRMIGQVWKPDLRALSW